MRLNAFLARAGVTSRRGADEMIKAGRVTVNDRLGHLNDQVSENDVVKLNNKQIRLRKSRNILLYKPTGYVTTLKDPQQRRKVIDLLDISERVVPVGRLDYDTTGALLLTNDGELANKLMHPRFKVDKVYEAVVKGIITKEVINKLNTGIELEDGRTAPAKAKMIAENKIELIIHEGRKHQVKRMLSAVGMKVIALHRSKYAGLDLSGLKPGQWRDLTEDEVIRLKRYTSK
ncbi:MAG TPA: pseudouridine synthase [Candidatus Saccharimonadales bacterium]|nr:pseudouridine synthase [Candidatus Saccharimonadales bacterium]